MTSSVVVHGRDEGQFAFPADATWGTADNGELYVLDPEGKERGTFNPAYWVAVVRA